MTRSEAARYARWSAAVACLLAMLTAGVYLKRKWVAREEKAKAPPPAPEGVSRQESGLTFSKGLGAQKLFTVEASKETNFKNNAASLLEDVKITIFGKAGERHDVIHTRSCEYERDGQRIICNGEVQLDLESAEDAEREEKNRGTAAQKIHVETHGLNFSRETGIAQSDQPVKFVFPEGQGQALGVEYHSEEGAVRLLRNVSFLLTPAYAAPKSRSSGELHEPVRVTANSADFERDSRIMHLRGVVEAQTARTRLLAGEITLALDEKFHAEKLVATAGGSGKNPELESRGMDSQTHLSGETLTARFTPEGWLTGIDAAGAIKGSQQNGKNTDEFSAETASMELWPRVNQPREMNLKGNVQLSSQMERTGESRTLQTGALVVEFAEHRKGAPSAPERAETLARGRLEWSDPVSPPGALPALAAEAGPAQTKLAADKIELGFAGDGKANQLVATGNVVAERTVPGKPVQTATAQNGNAQLLGSGWSQIELQGEVKLKEGERNGQGDRVVFVRSAQTATLTGDAVVRDATTETRAPRITFVQSSGEIRADGGVRSTDSSAKGTSLQLAAAPTNISADALRANSKSGRALYTGHARLWQGDSVMEADSMELLRETRILNAVGNVRAVFPQGPGQTQAQPLAVRQTATKKPRLWHITAGTLTYSGADSRAHLEKNVVAQSADQDIRAPLLDLYFTRSERAAPAPTGTSASATPPAGSQQIGRAVASGGVTVEQGTRRATAERGEYSAAEGKFIMSGGNPMIFDASEGTTTGRQLTFFLADDTIVVDSENGSRTLTKHRVEK
jgi:lipopolysaccharide export system protein LptA